MRQFPHQHGNPANKHLGLPRVGHVLGVARDGGSPAEAVPCAQPSPGEGFRSFASSLPRTQLGGFWVLCSPKALSPGRQPGGGASPNAFSSRTHTWEHVRFSRGGGQGVCQARPARSLKDSNNGEQGWAPDSPPSSLALHGPGPKVPGGGQTAHLLVSGRGCGQKPSSREGFGH